MYKAAKESQERFEEARGGQMEFRDSSAKSSKKVEMNRSRNRSLDMSTPPANQSSLSLSDKNLSAKKMYHSCRTAGQ